MVVDPNGFQPDCPSFLRWAGSKRGLLPILQSFWKPSDKRYLEPFAGSACLFFALRPPRAVLGDLNSDLISTYLELKYRVTDVVEQLALLPNPGKEEYLRLRTLDPKVLARAERAARFIYLNRFCFNGIYRTNLQGRFNVPFSGQRCGVVPGATILTQCASSPCLNPSFSDRRQNQK